LLCFLNVCVLTFILTTVNTLLLCVLWALRGSRVLLEAELSTGWQPRILPVELLLRLVPNRDLLLWRLDGSLREHIAAAWFGLLA
jgi:hypothetical protein